MALDDCRGDVHELAAIVLGMVPEHFESSVGVDAMACHEDPLGLFDRGAAPEGPLEVLVLGEALQCDVDGALQLLGVPSMMYAKTPRFAASRMYAGSLA